LSRPVLKPKGETPFGFFYIAVQIPTIALSSKYRVPMLRRPSIKNFAMVDLVTMEFGPDFNIETCLER
jgi:hypothetical protein